MQTQKPAKRYKKMTKWSIKRNCKMKNERSTKAMAVCLVTVVIAVAHQHKGEE
jgi:hypothetical protein